MSRTGVCSCFLFLLIIQLIWAKNPCNYEGDAVKCPAKSKFLCLLLKRNLQTCADASVCPCATRCCDLGCGNYCWPSVKGQWKPMAEVQSNVLSRHRKKRETLNLHPDDPLAMALARYPPESVVHRYLVGDDVVLIEKLGGGKLLPPGYPAKLPNRFDNYPVVSPQTKHIPASISERLAVGKNKIDKKVVRPGPYPKKKKRMRVVPTFIEPPQVSYKQVKAVGRSAGNDEQVISERTDSPSSTPVSSSIKHLFPLEDVTDEGAKKLQYLIELLQGMARGRLAKWQPGSSKPQYFSDTKGRDLSIKHLFPVGAEEENKANSIALLLKSLGILNRKKNIADRSGRKNILSKILGLKRKQVKLNFHLRVKNESNHHFGRTYPSPVVINGNAYNFMGRKGVGLPYIWSLEYKSPNTSVSETKTDSKSKKETKEGIANSQSDVFDTIENSEDTEEKDEFDVYIWYLKDHTDTAKETHKDEHEKAQHEQAHVDDKVGKQPVKQEDIPSSVENDNSDLRTTQGDPAERKPQSRYSNEGNTPQNLELQKVGSNKNLDRKDEIVN